MDHLSTSVTKTAASLIHSQESTVCIPSCIAGALGDGPLYLAPWLGPPLLVWPGCELRAGGRLPTLRPAGLSGRHRLQQCQSLTLGTPAAHPLPNRQGGQRSTQAVRGLHGALRGLGWGPHGNRQVLREGDCNDIGGGGSEDQHH